MVIKYGPWAPPQGEAVVPWNWMGPYNRIQAFGSYDGVPDALQTGFRRHIVAGDGPTYRVFWLYHENSDIDRLALGEDQAGFILNEDGKTLDRC